MSVLTAGVVLLQLRLLKCTWTLVTGRRPYGVVGSVFIRLVSFLYRGNDVSCGCPGNCGTV